MQASVEFTLPARVRKKGKWFVSSCDPLDVHSQGRTREEAERNLQDALSSFLSSCFERGTLDDVLRESGFVARAGRPSKRSGARSIAVPVSFSVRRARTRASA
jgi:predicted RNase H-like HicB family nuclease